MVCVSRRRPAASESCSTVPRRRCCGCGGATTCNRRSPRWVAPRSSAHRRCRRVHARTALPSRARHRLTWPPTWCRPSMPGSGRIRAGELSWPRLAPTEDAQEWTNALWQRLGLSEDQPVVALHPGSGSARKNWPAERFASVAALLAARDVVTLLIEGPADATAAAKVAALAGALHPPGAAGDARPACGAARPLPRLPGQRLRHHPPGSDHRHADRSRLRSYRPHGMATAGAAHTGSVRRRARRYGLAGGRGGGRGGARGAG